MKVVLIGSGIVPVPPSVNEMGGIEEYVYQLSNHLGELGCQAHVIDIKVGEQQEERRRKSSAKYYNVWRLPLPWKLNVSFALLRPLNFSLLLFNMFFFGWLTAFATVRLSRKGKFDVINAYTGPPALTTIVLNKMMRKPAVTVFYSQSALLNKKISRLGRILNFPEILPFYWADHIVTDTPTIKRVLVSDFGIDPAKITPMVEGIALPEDEVAQFLAGQKAPGHQSDIVLCVSSVNATKNQLTAVKAIPKVVAAHPEVKFIFAGDITTNYFVAIQKFIDENNLAPYVEFKGMVTRQVIYDLYYNSKVFIFPTTAESQGVVMVEAMTFGLPVVASSIEPIRDVVSLNEGSAIVVDPYDADGMANAIIKLLDDDTLRQSLSQKGKELAKGLSSKNNAARLLALFERLVAEKKGPKPGVKK